MISDDYIPIDVYILIGVITGAITYTQFDTTAPTETTPSEQNSYLSQLPSISSINPFSEDTKSATPQQNAESVLESTVVPNTQSVPEPTFVPNTETVPESPPVVPNAVPISDEPIKQTNNTTGTEPIMNIGGKRKQRKTKHRKQRKNKKKSFKCTITKN